MTDVYVAYGICLMCSFKAIPHRLPAARVRTWYLYSIRGPLPYLSSWFWKQRKLHARVRSVIKLGPPQAPGFLSLSHQCGGETWASFPLVLMEPVVWIHHISMCILSCFDILMHEITSLGKGLPLLKCSQFPLMIMEKTHTHTHPLLLRKVGKIWKMIRFQDCHRRLEEAAERVYSDPFLQASLSIYS